MVCRAGTSTAVDDFTARPLAAQTHAGENIGETETHVIFVELKQPPSGEKDAGEAPLGPAI
jgi:beta-alanine degradation protein BauB